MVDIQKSPQSSVYREFLWETVLKEHPVTILRYEDSHHSILLPKGNCSPTANTPESSLLLPKWAGSLSRGSCVSLLLLALCSRTLTVEQPLMDAPPCVSRALQIFGLFSGQDCHSKAAVHILGHVSGCRWVPVMSYHWTLGWVCVQLSHVTPDGCPSLCTSLRCHQLWNSCWCSESAPVLVLPSVTVLSAGCSSSSWLQLVSLITSETGHLLLVPIVEVCPCVQCAVFLSLNVELLFYVTLLT